MISKVSKGLLKASTGIVSRRSTGLYPYYYPYLVVPPEKRVGFAEKAFWGIFMLCGFSAYPIWVMTHVGEYRGGWNTEH